MKQRVKPAVGEETGSMEGVVNRQRHTTDASPPTPSALQALARRIAEGEPEALRASAPSLKPEQWPRLVKALLQLGRFDEARAVLDEARAHRVKGGKRWLPRYAAILGRYPSSGPRGLVTPDL